MRGSSRAPRIKGEAALNKYKSMASSRRPITTRKRRLDVSKNKQLPTYAKVARRQYQDDLYYAVIDTGIPSRKIPKDQRDQLEDLVNNKIMEYILEGNEATPIKIMSSEYKRGVLMMKLTSHQCASTLKELIKGIPPPWEGAKLDLVKRKDIPTLIKTSVYLKGWGSKFPSDRILDVIGTQNKGLNTKKWEVFHREENPEGSLLVMGIDQDSMNSLIKTKGMAFFVSKAIFFKINKIRIGKESQHDDNSELAQSESTIYNEKETLPQLPAAKEEVSANIINSVENLLDDQ